MTTRPRHPVSLCRRSSFWFASALCLTLGSLSCAGGWGGDDLPADLADESDETGADPDLVEAGDGEPEGDAEPEGDPEPLEDSGHDRADLAGPDEVASSDGDEVTPRTDAQTLLDLTYRSIDGIDLQLDLRVPEGAGPFPAVVVVHGGGFFQGDKAETNALAWAETLPGEGYVSASVNYRLDADFPADQAAFPDPVDDVKCAIRWLRTHAEQYRLDAEALFVLGGSAGGYFANAIATMGNAAEREPDCPDTTTDDSSVRGAVTFYGIADWASLVLQREGEEPGLSPFEAHFVGDDCGVDPSPLCAEASPNDYLDPDDPPVLLLHSVDDPTIPVAQSLQFRDEGQAMGVPMTYIEVYGLGHGWSGVFSDPQVDEARTAVLSWLRSVQ